MIDPMTSRLAQVQCQEWLVAAERRRQQAKWQAAPHRFTQLIVVLRSALGLKRIQQPRSAVKHPHAAME